MHTPTLSRDEIYRAANYKIVLPRVLIGAWNALPWNEMGRLAPWAKKLSRTAGLSMSWCGAAFRSERSMECFVRYADSE